ncbi:hypothetical protein E2C01_068003 [Portunus trituberculatus]|uniref:Uncharacterized protein n=1 Tax=Portunus trituberculatus TaxID=210409 RepID=A0A5B7HWR2_PORTR|nr:hypothetical protein [Portunus trituberculatus]
MAPAPLCITGRSGGCCRQPAVTLLPCHAPCSHQSIVTLPTNTHYLATSLPFTTMSFVFYEEKAGGGRDVVHQKNVKDPAGGKKDDQVLQMVGTRWELMTVVRRRQLRYLGNVLRGGWCGERLPFGDDRGKDSTGETVGEVHGWNQRDNWRRQNR